jgi:hypothetical protein
VDKVHSNSLNKNGYIVIHISKILFVAADATESEQAEESSLKLKCGKAVCAG